MLIVEELYTNFCATKSEKALNFKQVFNTYVLIIFSYCISKKP